MSHIYLSAITALRCNSSSNGKMKMRNYQSEVMTAITENERNVIVALPTGGGKSIIVVNTARHYIEQGKKVVVSVMYTALIPQLKKHLESDGMTVSVVKAGMKTESKADVVLVMEQTFYARREHLDLECDVLIRDEFHTGVTSKRYAALINDLEPSRVIGLTATPITELGMKLDTNGVEFDLINKVTTKRLIEEGYLIKPVYVVPREAELMNYGKIAVSNGDYNTKQLDVVLNTPKHNKYVVSKIKQYASERNIAVYANSIEHVEALTATLNKEGITAVMLHSKLTDAQNDEAMAMYEEGKAQCIVSMSKLTTGWDSPRTTCVVFVRPTKVLRLAIQICGRGLRIDPENGKEDCLVLDLSKMLSTHGLLDEEYRFDLETKEEVETAQAKAAIDEAVDLADEPIDREIVLEYRNSVKDMRIDSLMAEIQGLRVMVSQSRELEKDAVIRADRAVRAAKTSANTIRYLRAQAKKNEQQVENAKAYVRDERLARMKAVKNLEYKLMVSKALGEIDQNKQVHSKEEKIAEVKREYQLSDNFKVRLQLVNAAYTMEKNQHSMDYDTMTLILNTFDNSTIPWKNKSCVTKLSKIAQGGRDISSLISFIEYIQKQYDIENGINTNPFG